MDHTRKPFHADSETVRTLIRQGRIEAALGELQSGVATEQQLTEELRTYQAELLLQNDQLRTAEQAAVAALEHFRQMFLAHPEPVLQLDARGQIVDCNDAAARLFGIGTLDGLHLYFSQRVVSEHRGIVLSALAAASNGGAQQVSQIALLTAAGETSACWDMRFSGIPLETAGLPRCIAVLVDQSRMLLRQDELQKRIDDQALQFSQLHAQAVAAGAGHARLTQRLVGEIQQPLTRVARFARSLRDAAAGPDDATLKSQLDGIIESTHAMQQIVGALAAAIQAESGQMKPRKSCCEFGFLLREAVRIEQSAAPNGVSLVLTGPTSPVTVLVDFSLANHLLRALLRSAMHLADPGSSVRVEWAVRGADEQMPAHVEFICVRPGARRPLHELANMFSLFSSDTGAIDGQATSHLMMLGVRVMAEMHGGRVWAANVADGVALHLWLPLGS